jgi:ubiquinone/menaquinone biosynthesis C-methylase UbiE
MRRRRWLVPVAIFGTGLGILAWRRGVFSQAQHNLQTSSMPSARSYDTMSELFQGGWYTKLAGEIAAASPSGAVLDVGCGPGQLAVRLGRIAPSLDITGVDISPDMIERAQKRATQLGLTDRVRFQEGDSQSLPFPDDHFDTVVSTLSIHHWDDPELGLREIRRVVKPGGHVFIYDMADSILKLMHHGNGLEGYVSALGLRDATIEPVRWPWSLPLFKRLSFSK